VGRSGERDRVRTMVGSGAARGAETERRRARSRRWRGASCDRASERARSAQTWKCRHRSVAVLLMLLRRDGGRGWRRRICCRSFVRSFPVFSFCSLVLMFVVLMMFWSSSIMHLKWSDTVNRPLPKVCNLLPPPTK
jgi:hypothetical protein